MDADEALLRMPQLKRMVGLSHNEIYKRIRQGRFPKQVSLGPASVAWRRSEILRWIAELPLRENGHD